jgi:nitroimidazol reductase NimA-like FMN-containing flavoprotein (pyridoxamine 5'-phosphate oxidase superfamily)
MAGDQLPVEPHTRIRRLAERQRTDRAELYRIVDAALVAHVAVVRDGFPVVIPFACARDEDALLLHGSTGSGVLRAAQAGEPVSVGVTLLDGLVVARSVFDNSMNYRSVVAFGVPEVLEGDAKLDALRVLVDRILPGRWNEVRESTRKELAKTLILRLDLDEVSVKVRSGAVTAEDDDGEDRGAWTGVIPLATWVGDPVTHGDVPSGVPVPESVRTLVGRLRDEAGRIDTATRRAAEVDGRGRPTEPA